MLKAMKFVKLYCWEMIFAEKSKHVRGDEMKGLRKSSIAKGLNMAWAMLGPLMVTFVTLSTYVGLGGTLTASQSFVTIALINAVRFPLTVFPIAVKNYFGSLETQR